MNSPRWLCLPLLVRSVMTLLCCLPTWNTPMAQSTHGRHIILTRARPAGAGSDVLVAPGYGKQAFTIYTVDTRDFAEGGFVRFLITVGNGPSAASFDLFPEIVPIPVLGPPTGTVAGSYDVSPGERATLVYEFPRGQIFRFGATGNWFSEAGSQNSYSFSVEVTAKDLQSTAGETGTVGCDVAGNWRQRTDEVGESIWSFTPAGGNRFEAHEQGLANATGAATLHGNVLRLDWTSPLGYAGFYEWQLDASCTRGGGRAVGTQGLIGTRTSAVERSGVQVPAGSTGGPRPSTETAGPEAIIHIPDRGLADCVAYYLSRQVSKKEAAGLQEMSCRDRGIRSLEGIQHFTGLKVFWTVGNQISDLTPLRALPQIAELNLAANQISDLAPLRELLWLVVVDVSNNQVTELAPLAGLIRIEQLQIANNRIQDIGPLGGLFQIRRLSVAGNRVRSVAVLSGLGRLTDLDISYNCIEDLSPAERIENFKGRYQQDRCN